MAADRGPRAERVRAALLGVVAVGAVLVPLTRDLRHDSFPLSNYPMFTARRPQVTTFERAIGVAADGTERVLSPEQTGGTVEVIHAAQTIYDAIQGGYAGDLCAEIAGRIDVDDHVAAVLVVTERFEIVRALRADDPEPVDREVHARCEVGL
jgi:hypothetical protein